MNNAAALSDHVKVFYRHVLSCLGYIPRSGIACPYSSIFNSNSVFKRAARLFSKAAAHLNIPISNVYTFYDYRLVGVK